MTHLRTLATKFEETLDDPEAPTQRFQEILPPPETKRSPTLKPIKDEPEVQLAKLLKHKLRQEMILTGPIKQGSSDFDHTKDVSFDILVPGDKTSTHNVEQAMQHILGNPTQSNERLHIWNKNRVRIVWAHVINEANWIRVMERQQSTVHQQAKQFELASK